MINNTFAHNEIGNVLTEDYSYTDLFVLTGLINSRQMSSSVEIIADKLQLLNSSRTTISKAKLLSVEIIQNIIRHQQKNATLQPYFLITMGARGLKMKTGNSVSIQDFDVLRENLDCYQQLPKEKLKEMYIKKLSEGKLTETGGAGLGLLTIFIRSDKNTAYALNKIGDNTYLFSMEIDLNYHI